MRILFLGDVVAEYGREAVRDGTVGNAMKSIEVSLTEPADAGTHEGRKVRATRVS